ncbi:MAG: Dna2/Cas4 domain-containing protein [Chloroflexota bacterium]|nr:Dna2/Cas4 domain-containing protein [Chloroflexota bacterium]PLS82216.1 MAG: CRISPR-associated protein Cas4 [Chloroflexota bacterium]
MSWILLIVAVLLLVAALRLRRASGLPWARIRIADTGSWRAADQPLMSYRYGLVGKPDYLLETRAGLIPVELKPSRRAKTPYAGDLMQLAAYCLLVEDATQQAPPYGLLRYATHTFRMPYTAAVRADLLALLDELRQDRNADEVARSHQQAARCRGCGFYTQCEDRLG